MVEYNSLIEWLFYAIISGCAVLSVKAMSKLTDSVDALNIKVAVILEKVTRHEMELSELDGRVRHIENKGV